MKFNLKKPCPKCPFRNDIKPYIRAARVDEITRQPGIFTCHETLEHDEEGESCISEGSSACAGFLILMEKEGQVNQMMRISERLGLYDRNKLDMDAPVYDSIDEMIDEHEK